MYVIIWIEGGKIEKIDTFKNLWEWNEIINSHISDNWSEDTNFEENIAILRLSPKTSYTQGTSSGCSSTGDLKGFCNI